MHDIDRNTMEFEPESDAFEMDEFEGPDVYGESVFSEEEEMALATELLSISDEAELDQFLGKLFKRAWRGVKKVGSTLGRVARPLMSVLKPLVKKAMPFLGGALGSLIPIPGVGTAVGSALGKAVGSALETEFEGMNPDEMEFEMARRFVRIAGNAAQQVAQANPGANPAALANSAVTNAARQHVPGLAALSAKPGGAVGRGSSGRWVRRGNKIILLGV